MTDFWRNLGWTMWAVGLVAGIAVGIIIGYLVWGAP